MPAPLLSKEEIITRLLAVFRAWGYHGSSMSLISKETGLGKASLYHHFPGGKEQMVQEVLDHVGENLKEFVIAPLSDKSRSIDERIDTMVKNVDHFYKNGQQACVIESLSLEKHTAVTEEEIKKHIKAWLKAMTLVAQESGLNEKEAKQRAEEVLISIQGSLVMARATGNKSIFSRALSRIPRILTA